MVHIVGAGPASIVAALNLVKNGYKPIIHEQNSNVGMRFNGDFQGIENWSTREDALSFLSSIGVKVNFKCEPYTYYEFYGPSRKKVLLKTSRPLFYLVERGSDEQSIDYGLMCQAIDAGVEFVWNDKLETVPEGTVIVGTGPKSADAIAKGIVFSTSHPNIAVGMFDNTISPKAYAYLLVSQGKATFATCLFEDFKNEREYFEKAIERLHSIMSIDINSPKEFGGFVNFFLKGSATKSGRILYVGKNAGFQDALWGFGMRYAMLSGYLAARSITDGLDYNSLCDKHIRPMMRASLANRLLFSALGNRGYDWVLNRFANSEDIIPILRKFYNPSRFTGILFKIASMKYHTRLIDKECMHRNCNCVWCRHGKYAHKDLDSVPALNREG
ncbi:MAG: hypothetical protein ACP5JH_03205 [Bacteroidota bacterium]